MEPILIVWLLGIIVFVILEAVTYQLISIWFAAGAAGGLIAAIAGASWGLQMTVFLVLSVLFLLCLRPVSRKLIRTKKENTNTEGLIGKEVFVIKGVDNIWETGEGKINGMIWSVKSADNSAISDGETVIVERIEGVKLIVKRKEA